MELHVYLAFVVATAIMIALPGPSVLLTVAHSISFGWQPALFTVAGATTGIAVQLIVAAIGLTSLLNVVAEAFEWLRWAGAAYLVYLGIKQWRSANEPMELDTSSVSKRNLFVQGLVVTIPNPKSLIFIAAFLPQFIDATRPFGLQFSALLQKSCHKKQEIEMEKFATPKRFPRHLSRLVSRPTGLVLLFQHF